MVDGGADDLTQRVCERPLEAIGNHDALETRARCELRGRPRTRAERSTFGQVRSCLERDSAEG